MDLKFAAIALWFIFTSTSGASVPLTQRSRILPIPVDYVRTTRPNAGAGPTEVAVSVYVNSIEALKNHKMTLVLYLRTYWTDHRLKHSKNSALTFKSEDILPKIWSPDLFFPNALEPSKVINKGFVRITPSGEIIHSQMTKEVLACTGATLAFATFRKASPGIQCSIEVESYGFSTADIVVKPKSSSEQSIAIDAQAMLSEYYRVGNFTASESIINLSTGSYNRIRFWIEFESNLDKLGEGTLLRLLEHGLEN